MHPVRVVSLDRVDFAPGWQVYLEPTTLVMHTVVGHSKAGRLLGRAAGR